MEKKIKYKISEDDALLNSLGLLDVKTLSLFESGISEASDNEKKLIREYNNLSSLFSLTLLSGKFLTPQPSVKTKLLNELKSKTQTGIAEVSKDFEFIHSYTREWMPHPEIEGIKIKQLSFNKEKGYLMMLLKAAAGSVYPSHHHTGAEECYVLEGDLLVEGRLLGPGDFHHAEGGSDHDTLRTKNGCTLLMVIDQKNIQTI